MVANVGKKKTLFYIKGKKYMRKIIWGRLLSLAASILLFLISLPLVVVFVDFRIISFKDILIGFSGFLYFGASILLMLDFLNVKIFWVKKGIWLPLYMLGFAPKVILIFFWMWHDVLIDLVEQFKYNIQIKFF